MTEPRPAGDPGGGEVGPEVQEGSPRSGKCGADPMVPRALPRPARSFLLTVYAITVTGILANTLVAPALPDIAADLGLSGGGAGAIVAAASVPGIFVAPLIGVFADRFGRRAVVVPCLVVFSVGGLLAMLAPSFVALLGARLLQGFGAAGLVNLSVVLLGDRFDGIDRARAIGRNAAVLTAALAVLPTIGGGLTAIGGWRLAFAPYALALVVAIASWRVLPDDRPTTVTPWRQQTRAAGSSLREPRAVAMLVAGFAAFALLFGLALTALPLHLDERFGLGPLARGLLLGIPAASAVTVSLRIGSLAQRFGTWALVLSGFALWAVGFGAVAVAPAVALVAGAAVLWGIGEGLTIVPLQAYAATIAPHGQRGIVVAVWVGAARAGQSVGPALAGVVIGVAGTEGVFTGGAVIAASIVVVGGVLLRRTANPHRRRSATG